MLRRILLCTLPFTAMLVAQAPPPGSSVPGSIDGKVVASTGAPVRRAVITVEGTITLPQNLDPQNASAQLQQILANRKSFSAETDDEGRFSLPAVDAGSYTMSVTRSGYIPDRRQIAVTAGSKMSGMVVTLILQSIIEGRTLDEYGDPISQAQVSVFRRIYSTTTGWTMTQVKSANSGADGRYSIGELEAGRYYVSAADPRSNTISGLTGIIPTQVQQERKPEYVTTYYPNVTEQTTAAGVDVAASTEVRGIDIRIQRALVYRVRGKAVTSGTLQNTIVRLTPAGAGPSSAALSQNIGMMRADDGTFQFLHVQPGTYNLQYSFRDTRAAANAPTMVGRLTVTVTDKDVDDLVLQVAPAGEIKGHLRIEAKGTQPSNAAAAGPQPQVSLSTADLLGMSARAPAKPDGSFVLSPVGPGDYRVDVNPMPQGAYLRSVRYGGQDVTNKAFTLGYGSFDELEVVLASDGATVNGEMHDDKGSPITAGSVLVWSAANPAFSRYGAIVPAGTFQVGGLPPGDYRVLAFEVASGRGDNVMASPEFLSQFNSTATPVKLGSGETQTVTPKMVPKATVDQAVAKLR